MKNKLGKTVFFTTLTWFLPIRFAPFPLFCDSTRSLLKCSLQHSRTGDFILACLSRRKDANFFIFCNPIIFTSSKVCTRQVSFLSVNNCMVYKYYFGTSTAWVILYLIYTSFLELAAFSSSADFLTIVANTNLKNHVYYILFPVWLYSPLTFAAFLVS
jgi:hypothetical protein